ncbi:MAG: M20/M25/M40 family metallo-hydrolase, partial [Gemmatimonadota bacterium]
SDAAAVAARIATARPDLELRAILHPQVTDADLAWSECYVGFRRPPVATMGGVRWVHSTGAGVDPWLAPDALAPATLLTRSPERFGPAIADGYVWGRGTLDDKTTVLATLEAVERLIESGYVPPRTVYLMFGHDEENGGRFGARAIVDTLVVRGVKPALVVDEGGFLASGVIPGVQGRAAIVGIAEKGYVSFRLTASANGGHSSMPPSRTAV